MAQRMIIMEKVRRCNECLKANIKIVSTLNKLLRIDDLSPIVLRGTQLEARVSKLLLTPQYRVAAFKIIKRIRSLKRAPEPVKTPMDLIKESKTDFPSFIFPPPPSPPSPVDLVLSTKDQKLVMTTIRKWLENVETQGMAKETMKRLREICPDGMAPQLA